MTNDLVRQAVRVAANTAAGTVGAFLLSQGFEVDHMALLLVLTAVISSVYAVAIRLLANHIHPLFGYLQLVPSQPQYEGVASR